MKISITDQFLWKIYNSLEPVGNAIHFFTGRRSRGDLLSLLLHEFSDQVNNRKQFTNLVYYLKKHNYIKIQTVKEKPAVLLTKKGKERARKVFMKMNKGPLVKRKDGKWVMIVFDIPQKHTKARALLRSVLKNLGYEIFQHSVWVTPYDVSEKTEELLRYYSLNQYIDIFLIEKV